MFKCRLCNEKDHRISDLQAYIATLEKLTMPPKAGSQPSYEAQELDRLLSGSDEPIEIDDAAALLTGTYDNAQVEFDG